MVHPDPEPTSSTLCPGCTSSSSSMARTVRGWLLVWPWPMSSGPSYQARRRSFAGRNRRRDWAAIAASTRPAATVTPAGPRAPSRRHGGRWGRRRHLAQRGGGHLGVHGHRQHRSTSPPMGPAEVAPTSTPRRAVLDELDEPRCPPWIQPRVDSPAARRRRARRARRRGPAARSGPTAPTSGSVNVTRGTAWYSACVAVAAEDVGERDGGLVHRHVGEGALARDVADRPEPLTGAHRRWSRRHAPAGRARRSPGRGRPMLARRPAATSSRSPVSSRPVPSASVT